MMKKLVSALLAVMLIVSMCASAMAISIRGVGVGMTLYVVGGSLNVRDTPSKKGTKLYSLPEGTAVIAGSEYDNGYLFVEPVSGYSNGGYVDIRYLDVNKPKPAEKVSSLSFKSYKLVTDVMIVTAKPKRKGGNCNLRWAPSQNAQLLEKVYEGDELTVIAEGQNWYQVQNDEGYVGFIAKNYTSIVYQGDGSDYTSAK